MHPTNPLPPAHGPGINDRQKRRSQQTSGEQSGEGMVEMARAEWSDLRQENSNENEAPRRPDSDSTDFALRLRNLANVRDEKRMATTDIYENGAMGNGGEPVGTPEKLGDLEDLEEARVVPIAMVMRRQRLQ